MPDMIAERLLRLFASREEASTIAGDLRELAVTRGKLWFWFAVARTVPSLLWRDLTSAPLFLLGLAVRGLLVMVSLWTLIGFITLGLLFRLAQIAGLTNPGIEVVFTAMWLCTITLIQFITGLYLARHSRGREVASVLAYIGIYNILRIGLIIVMASVRWHITVSRLNIVEILTTNAVFGNNRFDQLATFLKFAPLFLAAILARVRSRPTLGNA
jgi:hypothetical protein